MAAMTLRGSSEPSTLLVSRLGHPLTVLRTLGSFEALFVLFLFAGRYKLDPRLAWVPFDLTAFWGGISLVVGLALFAARCRCRISSDSAPFLASMVLLVVWMVTSLAWTPGRLYANQKVFYLSTLVMWGAFASSSIIARSPQRARRFYTLVFLFGLWTLVESISGLARQGVGGFLRTFGANYLAMGNTLGWSGVIVFVHLTMKSRSSLIEVIAMGAYLILVVVLMLAGGGRGPLVSFVLTIAAMWSALSARMVRGPRVRIARSRVLAFVVSGLAILSIVTLASDLDIFTTADRLRLLVDAEGGGTSAAARIDAYATAWRLIQERPVTGHGIGSFPVLSSGTDIRGYPHNIFLEIFVEGGLIGTVVFLSLLLSSAKSVFSLSTNASVFSLAACGSVLYFFFAAQFSGDLTDNRYLFVSLGMLAGAYETTHLSLFDRTGIAEPNPPIIMDGRERRQHSWRLWIFSSR